MRVRISEINGIYRVGWSESVPYNGDYPAPATPERIGRYNVRRTCDFATLAAAEEFAAEVRRGEWTVADADAGDPETAAYGYPERLRGVRR